MKTTKANIVSFYELSEEWQKEAISNLDEYATENHYLEPACDYDSNIILWDLNECMRQEGCHNGFEYNAVATVISGIGSYFQIAGVFVPAFNLNASLLVPSPLKVK